MCCALTPRLRRPAQCADVSAALMYCGQSVELTPHIILNKFHKALSCNRCSGFQDSKSVRACLNTVLHDWH